MPIAYLLFGSLVAAAGIALVLSNVRAFRRHESDESLSDADRQFFASQYARRMQTSALTVTFGALIGLCGYLKFEEMPVFSTCYVIGLLLLALWLILLAVSDIVATRVYAGKLDRQNRLVRRSLQQALDEVREAHGLDRATDQQ
ncbi:MAG: hypothetical protein Fues2KO_21620 [Fuerstiella sp.]|jgi:hypothetical protein